MNNSRTLLLDYLYTVWHILRFKPLFALLLMLLGSVLEGIGMLLLIPMLNVLMASPATTGIGATLAKGLMSLGIPLTLGGLLLLYMGLITLRSLSKFALSVLSTQIQQQLMLHLANRLYSAIVRSQWAFFARHRSADFAHTLTADLGRIGVGTSLLLGMITTVILTLVYLVLAHQISPLVSVAALTCAFGLWWLLRWKNRVAHSTGQKQTQLGSGLYQEMMEGLASMKLAKSLAAEERHIHRFSTANHKLKANAQQQVRNSAETRLYFEIGAALLLCLLLFLAIRVTQLPLAELIVLIALYARILPRFSGLQQNYQQLLHMLPAFAAYKKRQRQCDAAREYDADITPPHALLLERQIRLTSVSFRYRQSGPWNLQQLSFDLPANQTTAIIGPSGAGKTTLADLMMGLLTPQEGHIQIDDTLLTPDQFRHWRQTIAYVPQETFLFHDTVRANLLWAKPDANEADLWDALSQAAATTFVQALPQRLDTLVGDRGVRLSGGERQRIALARALLRNPRLLILDEATSALDHDNETRIQSALKQIQGQLTLLVIAHRLSTIQDADQIIVLEAGQVQRIGTWDSLRL